MKETDKDQQHQLMIDYINNKTPFSYSKYGDGEYLCAKLGEGENSNGCGYSRSLGNALIKSFKHIVDNSQNGFIGEWGANLGCPASAFFASLAEKPVKWWDYSLLLPVNTYDPFPGWWSRRVVDVYRAVKESQLKKIYVCNRFLSKAKSLLDIDVMVELPLSNWYHTHYDGTMTKIRNSIDSGEQCIILTSGGMASKVLIAQLSILYPNNIYLDIGSGLDKICTKTETRGHYPPYDEMVGLFESLLPDDWEDPKYDWIYEGSDKELGHFRNNTEHDRKVKESRK